MGFYIIEQVNFLRQLKRIGICMSYLRSTNSLQCVLTILAFANSRKSYENDQPRALVNLLLVKMTMNSIFQLMSWIFHKSKLSVKNFTAAKILSTEEDIDESKMITHVYMKLLKLEVRVHVCVDSKNLSMYFSTHHNFPDLSIRSDIAWIKYGFQVGNVNEISGIAGKLYLADVLTKSGKSLNDMLQLKLFTGRI